MICTIGDLAMIDIKVEKMYRSKIFISPAPVKRSWMDNTSDHHAYKCFPVSLANTVGWNLSCSEDINFIWNGANNESSDSITVLDKKDYIHTNRGNGSLSFVTGLVFKTEENVSLLTINPINYFNDEFETMSSLISTSFYDNPLPLAIKAKTPNKEILIKAGTPLATIIPISLTNLNNSSIEMYKYEDFENKRHKATMSYGDAAMSENAAGRWTNWYRDAINEKKEKIGSHEVKSLRLSVNDHTGEI